MPSTADRELRRLLRRVRIALFFEGFAAASVVVAALGGTALVAARLFGHWIPPSWWWAFALVPPLVWGLARVARRAWDPGTAAVALDRRFGLGGLLLTGLETSNAAWRGALQRRLEESSGEQPALRTGRWAGRAALAAVFVAAVCLLPEPRSAASARASRILEIALEDVSEDIELALEDGVVSEARGEELRQRAKDLHRRLEGGDEVSWGDVDALAERLTQEQSSHVGGLQTLQAGFHDFADQPGGGDSEHARLEHERMRDLLQRASDLGLLEDVLDQLPEELRKQLEEAAQRAAAALPEGLDAGGELQDLLGKLDPRQLGVDPETMQRLFDALGDGALKDLKRLAQKGRLPKQDILDLQDVLEAEGLLAGGKGQQGKRTNQPGRGGVDRGRADADLNFAHQTDADTTGLRPRRLPPGVAVPDEWQVAGVSRAVPVADPQASAGGSGGGDVSGAGRATWRRRLAPRHREAVRRFFSTSERR